MKNFALLFTLICVSLGWTSCGVDKGPQVTALTLETLTNPEGVSADSPRFSWQISSGQNNLCQTSYRIQVAQCPKALEAGELVWDSGEQPSDQSVLVPYTGEALEKGAKYYWRVQAGTNQGVTPWSETACWSTAPCDGIWSQAQWIGENNMTDEGESKSTHLAARYLRKAFNIDGEVASAYLYISGLGSYEAYLNGIKTSQDVLSPMPSVYTKTVYYNTYDVTDLLSQGENTIGVVLGNGRYCAPKTGQDFGLPRLIACITITHKDGTKTALTTDGSWKVTSKGPITSNDEFDGETYDTSLEMNGWNANGFDDSAWIPADIMDAPGGELVAQQNPNIQVQEEIEPVEIIARADGKYILDMGQNMVGWLRMSVNAKAGQSVTLKFAETLQDDTTLYTANLRKALCTDTYTPAADGAVTWEPTFTYRGFRFVEIDGLDYQPSTSDFTGRVVYDKMRTTGQFTTSNALVTQIHKNAYWGIRGNYRGMPTDCPQRNERQGWLGDRATGCYGEAFILDNSYLYTKWLQDIEDSMSEEGAISVVSPYFWKVYNGDVTWPSAFFYGADMLYHQYGNDASIKKHYQAMRKWMAYTEANSMEDDIFIKDAYGDWCMPPESPELIHSKDPARKTAGAILSTTVYYDLLHKMMKFATICGQEEDIPAYREKAQKIKAAYNAKYFDSEKGCYGNNTVTANILSLRLGLVPEGYEQKVFDNIVKVTEEDFGGHVSVGVLGIQHLMRGLTEYGRTDLAYKILTNTDYPSYGYMIANGATTIWELWNGNTADPAMNSGNHVMLLGDLMIWYYENLAGIKCAEDEVAYKKLIMAPVFPDGLDRVSASYESVYGKISSTWERKGDKLKWDITLPGNTSAVVRIPKSFGIDGAKGALKTGETDQYTEFEIASGSYRFGK